MNKLFAVGGCILLLIVIGSVGKPTPAPAISATGAATASVSTAAALPEKSKGEIALQTTATGARQLKNAMRNPDSFKLAQALLMPGGAACYEYRAQNGFGGMNVGQAVRSPVGTIVTNEMIGFSRLWRKECAGKMGSDRTWEVGLAAGLHGLFSED